MNLRITENDVSKSFWCLSVFFKTCGGIKSNASFKIYFSFFRNTVRSYALEDILCRAIKC